MLSVARCAQLLDAPLRRGDADHRHVERAALGHRIERRKDLLVRQVAGDPEQPTSASSTSCASTRSASSRSMPCRKRTAGIRACRWAPRRWPTRCGRAAQAHPANPDWPDRDRFVLSAGHGSMLLYSLLHLTGYDAFARRHQAFRQWGSKTPGHPERGHTPGVEITTGPWAKDSANAVGMAMAEAQLAARYNRPASM
jgi:hypothetical protein